METLISSCGVLEVKKETATVYAHLRLTLKQRGHPIPENDLWIAALCIEHAIPLDTDDRHFLPLEDLQLVAR